MKLRDDFQQMIFNMFLTLALLLAEKIIWTLPIQFIRRFIPRELTYSTQLNMPQQQVWYVNADGSINMHKMLTEFTQFYRENSADWLADCKYKESGPHLLMMAFLQRIINGGGRIHREYALGRDV